MHDLDKGEELNLPGQIIGTKRSSTASANPSHARKRRRNDLKHPSGIHDYMGNNPASASPHIAVNEAFMAEPAQNSFPSAASSDSSTMASQNFGRNRLATGYQKLPAKREDSKSSGEITASSNAQQVVGHSSASPIAISDDEMEDSEGGMVINIDKDNTLRGTYSSSDAQSEESGEIVSTPKKNVVARDNSSSLFVIDPKPSAPLKRLIDLESQLLDEQLRYAFFHLNRHQIDLNRPVICLCCKVEGHLHHDCKAQNGDTFPAFQADSDAQHKLWISCCACASKTHLVGDCPQLEDDRAARWSLKSLNPDQIVNLSLESGMTQLEKEAENRGMRPEGMQIRGHASLHRAGVPGQRDSSEEDEPFLRRPVANRNSNATGEHNRPPRYDRYDAPSSGHSYRGGGDWYATDSFGGRRRSRSPEERYDSYRPRQDHQPSHGSATRRGWRPCGGEHHDGPRERRQSPRGSRAPTAMSKSAQGANQGSNIQFSLPTRKGSNTWSQTGQSGTSTPTNSGTTGDSQQHQKGRNRNNNKNKKKKKN